MLSLPYAVKYRSIEPMLKGSKSSFHLYLTPIRLYVRSAGVVENFGILPRSTKYIAIGSELPVYTSFGSRILSFPILWIAYPNIIQNLEYKYFKGLPVYGLSFAIPAGLLLRYTDTEAMVSRQIRAGTQITRTPKTIPGR